MAVFFAAVVVLASDPAREGRLAAIARVVDPAAPIRIGDVVTVEVDVRGDGVTDARLEPGPGDARLDVVGDPEAVERGEEAGVDRAFRVRFQVFATGPMTIPPFRVVAASSGGTVDATTAPLPIVVEPLTDARSEPAAAKLVLPDAAGGALVPVLAASVVAAAIAFRGYRRAAGRPVPGEIALAAALLRAFRRGDAVASAEPVVSVRTVLEQIDALSIESEQAYDAGAMHERLASLAVGYLEATLGMRRRERTSAELVRVAGARLGRQRAAEIEHVLGACDLVKFARAAPDAAEFRAVASELAAFVRAVDARR
jgi:hypothetical protein